MELSDEIYDQIQSYWEEGNDYCDNEEWLEAIKCFNKAFDTIPEQFDKIRPRYSAVLFEYFIKEAGIGVETKVLEIGSGTGQATDPILGTW